MIPKYLAAVLAVVAPLLLRADPTSSAGALVPPEGIHITNGVLTVGISARDAGAVNSIVYDGAELVNDHDHGRQLQIAWSYKRARRGRQSHRGRLRAGRHRADVVEPVAGSADQARDVGDQKSHPAYWLPPGYRPRSKQGIAVACTQPVTADTLEKTLTLGEHGDPHVIVIDSAITISPVLTGPAVTSIIVETPAFYVSGFITEHYLLDRSTGDCTQGPTRSARASTDPQRGPTAGQAGPTAGQTFCCIFLLHSSRRATVKW